MTNPEPCLNEAVNQWVLLPVVAVLPTDTLLSAPLLESVTPSEWSVFTGLQIPAVSSCSASLKGSYMSQTVTFVAVDMQTSENTVHL